MKRNSKRAFVCCKCLVIFYLILNCVAGLAIAAFASYLLLFHQEAHLSKPKAIVLYFLIVPPILVIVATTVGWIAVKRKSTKLLKLFAVLLAISVLVEIGGCLWYFTSLSKINDEVEVHMEKKFNALELDGSGENWWSYVERKLQCCGLHGHTDYLRKKAVPFSCCGSDANNGSCSFFWQKGCSSAVSKEVSDDLLTLSLIALAVAFIQVPGVFISWCFANRLNKELL